MTEISAVTLSSGNTSFVGCPIGAIKSARVVESIDMVSLDWIRVLSVTHSAFIGSEATTPALTGELLPPPQPATNNHPAISVRSVNR